MTTSQYTVIGMSCEHCVASVTEEVGAVEGVDSLSVDLDSGALTIQSDGPVNDASVRAAVQEAGYEVT